MSPDVIAGLLSFIITLLILSYVIGDNPLFRFAAYLFVGVSAGYIAVVAMWQVLWTRLVYPLILAVSSANVNQILVFALPLFGAGLILMKASPGVSKLGSPALAYLVGVGAAVALGGALTGTLFPQVTATINAFDMTQGFARGLTFIQVAFNGGVILAGTAASLAYFHFGASSKPDGSTARNFIIEGIAWVGRVFIAITLGVIFAGVYAAALTALIERISFLAGVFGF